MTASRQRSIDINCDLGEGGPHDAALMPLVSSANVACGGHAGDVAAMLAAVTLARRHGVAIGAHPGHADRENFGRRELPTAPTAAAAAVAEQVARLEALAGESPQHVKLHGGLYHQAGRDPAMGKAIVQAIVVRWPQTVLVAFAGSPLVATARREGLAVAEEAFLDRAYAADGALVPRAQAGATIGDPEVVVRRAIRLVHEGRLEAIDGSLVPIHAHTLCIHGDNANSLAIATAVREALDRTGILIKSFRDRGP